MKNQFLVAVAAIALPFSLTSYARADDVVLADFEAGVNGLDGPITRDDSVAKVGKGSGKIEAKLAEVAQRPWITIRKPLDLRNQVQSVSFWVKSAEAKTLTVQVIDSTKQTLQVRPKLTPGADWQQVVIPSFESGNGFQAYGGANDKKVHWPISSLNILVEKNGLEDGNGTVWLDQISLSTEGAPQSTTPTLAEVTQGAQKVTLADFNSDLAGFNGPLTLDTTGGRDGKGAAKIEADLANVTASPWKTISRPLDLKQEIKAVSFWVKSAEAKQLTVKIVDATGQTLQVRPAVNPNGQWQQVTVSSFESGLGFQAYGGANDKKVHWPAQSFAIIVEKNGLEGGKGTVLLDDVEAFVNPQRLVGKLDLQPQKTGNVFF